MSVRGPVRCLCCGSEFNQRGCVLGFGCNCDQGLGADCYVCNKCKKHCQCDSLHRLAHVAFSKFHRHKLLVLIRQADKAGIELSIREQDIDPENVPVEQIEQIEQSIAELVEWNEAR